MSTTLVTVLHHKHAFAFLRHLRDSGPDSFSGSWRVLGCYPKSMARLGWVCEDCGLVSANGVHRYSLTAKGLAVLGDWERLMAHDGEPTERFAGRPADPAADKLARARAALEAGPVKVVHRGVAIEPMSPKFIDYDSDEQDQPCPQPGEEYGL